jgi:hypothetical protein
MRGDPEMKEKRGTELDIGGIHSLLQKEAGGRRRILIISKPVLNQKIALHAVSYFIKDKGCKGIMVNIRRPFMYSYTLFVKKNLPCDMLTFIDAITKISGESYDQNARSIILSCPFAKRFKSELADALERCEKPEFLIVDDLTSLLNYFSEDQFTDFAEDFSLMLRNMGNIPIILLADQSRDPVMLDWLCAICDVVVTVKGFGGATPGEIADASKVIVKAD